MYHYVNVCVANEGICLISIDNGESHFILTYFDDFSYHSSSENSPTVRDCFFDMNNEKDKKEISQWFKKKNNEILQCDIT